MKNKPVQIIVYVTVRQNIAAKFEVVKGIKKIHRDRRKKRRDG